MALTLSAYALISLVLFCLGNGERVIVEFEKNGIVGEGNNQLEFTDLKCITSASFEVIYHGNETKRNMPVTLRMEKVGYPLLEHEWKMFQHLGATIEMESEAKTIAEEAQAELPRVYGFGRIVSEHSDNLSGMVLVMEQIDGFLSQEVDKWDKFENDPEIRYIIGLQLLKNLDFLHSKKVRHGDISPAIYALMPSGDGKKATKISLIRIYSAEICDDLGFLVGTQTHKFTEADYRSLHLQNVLENESNFKRHITEDNESAAYTILRLFGIPFGWEADSIEMLKAAKALQDPSLEAESAAKLQSIFDQGRKHRADEKTGTPIRIHKELRKDYPQCDVLLEMIESARPATIPGHIIKYDYKVKKHHRHITPEKLFIQLWETENSKFVTKSLKASGSSSGIRVPLKLFGCGRQSSSVKYAPGEDTEDCHKSQ